MRRSGRRPRSSAGRVNERQRSLSGVRFQDEPGATTAYQSLEGAGSPRCARGPPLEAELIEPLARPHRRRRLSLVSETPGRGALGPARRLLGKPIAEALDLWAIDRLHDGALQEPRPLEGGPIEFPDGNVSACPQVPAWSLIRRGVLSRQPIDHGGLSLQKLRVVRGGETGVR